ncbi:MAG: hypothetical protein ACRDZ9_00395 [Acidimicrobiales bacterium]
MYLLRNTITNLTSQDEQVACFRNAARHLQPGGTFVIENYIPELRRIPPGENTYVFTATPTNIGVGEYDFANQIEISRHWWLVDGGLKTLSSPHRYVWPAELDLMARLAGLQQPPSRPARCRRRCVALALSSFRRAGPSSLTIEIDSRPGSTPCTRNRPSVRSSKTSVPASGPPSKAATPRLCGRSSTPSWTAFA